MKGFILEFLRRGSVAAGIGPIILAIVYFILWQIEGVISLEVNGVIVGIISLSALAFIAGGMNAIYQIERLPLMVEILIHGTVLYFGYLIVFLINGWLKIDTVSFVIFSAVFVIGFVIIWTVIYFIIRRSTAKLNEKLLKNRRDS